LLRAFATQGESDPERLTAARQRSRTGPVPSVTVYHSANHLSTQMSNHIMDNPGAVSNRKVFVRDMRLRAEEIRTQRLIDDVKYWRERAEEVRTEAEFALQPITRAAFLRRPKATKRWPVRLSRGSEKSGCLNFSKTPIRQYLSCAGRVRRFIAGLEPVSVGSRCHGRLSTRAILGKGQPRPLSAKAAAVADML
jgi:hypothetical protein